MTIRERFDAKWTPEPFSGCWLWTGMNSRGLNQQFSYGRIIVNARPLLAHRVSWQLHHGEIPEGVSVLHRCDTPICVNPAHLFLGTRADNNMDKAIKNRNAKTRKLTPDNARAIKRAIGVAIWPLAHRFNVSYRTIVDVRKGRTWKHI